MREIFTSKIIKQLCFFVLIAIITWGGITFAQFSYAENFRNYLLPGRASAESPQTGFQTADKISAVADGSININSKFRQNSFTLTAPPPDLYQVRIKLNNPTYANYVHAENPYNKSLVSIFQVDDSPKTIYNLLYPYFKGGVTAGGYSSPGVKSTDGCGNDLYWNISAACFVQDVNGVDLLSQGNPFISWSELAMVTANGPGLQRGFDYVNHGFGGLAVLQKDRYKQIYLNNKACFDHLGYHPESLVIPDTQIGFRFGANDLGMDVTSQAGVEPLKDGAVPLAEDAYTQDIYAAVQNPYFFRRNHWQEINSSALVAEHKSYILAAYNKSQVKPCIYNWFSHGPGEIGTSNFAYFREVIDYMQDLGGDDVIGLSLDQFLGYQKARYAAENGAGTTSSLTPDGYLEITFDMSGLQSIVRNRFLTLLIDSDAEIEDIEWSENIKAVTFNPSTGLVNIQLNEIVSIDPATLPVRPVIIAGTLKIAADVPSAVTFEVDRPITQSTANAYEITGNTVLSISEIPGSGGLKWKIQCAADFLSTDVITLTYKAEKGNALDTENGTKMLTYSNLPIINLSNETEPEEESLAISIRRDSDNAQLATFNTIAEVKAYMSTFNFNANISIVLNNDSTYVLGAKWTLDYNNTNYTLTIKGKDGLSSYPVIDCGGSTSDPFRVNMSHVRIKQLKIRSGKYTGDGTPFGDNYSGALISQQSGTSDCQYTYLILHQGMRGIKIGAANGTSQPNISNILIDHVVCTELTGVAIQVGIISSIEGEPEARTDASYTLSNVKISNITIRDTKDQADIENSGAKYYGQIHCRGVNRLTLQDIDSDQNQKQPYYLASCKNVLIDRCRATRFSLNTGSGYKAAFHIEDSELITIQNCFSQYTFENVYISGSTGIRLYHNTFDTQQADARAVSLPNVRSVLDIQGNLIVARGDAAGRGCIGASFYRGSGYIPTITADFLSEQNNLFITASYILEFEGLNANNVPLTVRTATATTFANYKTTYSRSQNSAFAAYAALIYTDINGIHGYLGNTSAGRNFIASQVDTITVDLTKKTRTFPTDVGAYNSGAIVSADLSSLAITAGAVSPAFTAATKNYTASVPYSEASVTVMPVLLDTLAAMEVRINEGAYSSLHGNTSAALALNVGANPVDIRVTSPDGVTINIYTITITRASITFSINPISDVTVNENTAYTGITPVINGIPHGNLKYTLSGPDAFDFTIDHSTGVVAMIPRNFESPADANADNVYEVTITAADASNNSAVENWTVTVVNIIEPATFTINAISDTTINENTVYTSIIPSITGTPVGGVTPANFTIVPIPDTQYYTGEVNGGNNSIFKAQTNWIVTNRNALNIKYLIHLGDCVQNGDNGGNAIEWMRADTAVSIVEDPVTTQLLHGIPYGLNVGNHDQSPEGSASGNTNLYNQYFGSSRFAGRDYYGGHYGTNNDNNFQLFSASGLDFIAVNMEYDPLANPQVLDWADNLLKTYPARRAIISSHYIINPDGSFGAQGQAIYNKLKANPNLFLMLCGHRNPNGEALRTDTFDGNTVYTLLSDYQDRANGGDGWMRYMEFMPSENKIYVSTYSPTLNQYETDANSRFVLDYAMTSESNPGSVTYTLSGADASMFTIDSSTGAVSMVARDFQNPADANADNIYELTIIATDADGNRTDKSWKVTVAPLNTDLSALSLSEGALSPVFASSVNSYTVSVSNLVASVKVTPVAADSNATIKVNGMVVSNGNASLSIPLSVGDNEIVIEVTTPDSAGTKAYTITVNRASVFPYSESFKNATASGMLFGGAPGAVLTAGGIDADGSGYLRLTSNTNTQSGFARNTTAFPSAGGLSASFDYYTYGGSGADGLSFFLYDATVSSFTIGGFGGSLGYAQNNSAPGVSKAFLGLGLDEFGNFSNPTAGRQGGPGQRASSVTLRGDGNGSAAVSTNYEYLTGIQTSNAAEMSSANAGTAFQITGGVDGRSAGGLDLFTVGYRRARIDLIPNGMGTGYKLNVWITEGKPEGAIVHHVIKDYSYIPTDSIPASLSYGFSAGTGAMNNYHEVRNLEIKLPEDITVPAPVLADISKSGTENQILTFTGTDFISKFSSPAGNPLAKIKILSLPAHGELKLNSSNITVNQEIVAADLGNIMFVPVSGFSGSASFQWNGSDGAQYAVSGANVTITLVSAPASVFPYSESFKNATASGMLFGGAPGAVLTAGGIDPHGSGYLRLTSNTNTQSGFARNTTAFPSAEGLSINFEYYTYGGSGADGIVFFLYDASVSSFQIGAFGGSLGYAQNAALPGISKGYMGFGFDEFGNFSNPTAGRQGGPGQRASSVTLRGDGNGTGSGNPSGSNYEHLISIQTTDAMAMSAAGAGNAFQVAGDVDGRTAGSTGLTPSMAGYRQARIELKPNGSGTGFKVNVWIREGNPSGGVEHHVVRDYMYVSTDPVPANLSYGFSAGTGAMNNYHEIRNLEIKLPEDITVPAPVLADISKNGTENQILTFTGTDFISKFSSSNPLVKVKILSLPAHGQLKLNSSNITVNQEIVAADLGNIMFVPVSGFSGSASFQWNGSDGTQYAVSGANVTITLVPIPASVFPYTQSFKNATASGLEFGNSVNDAILTAGGIDADGAGYLRLTSNTNTQSGFARNTTAFPSAGGLSASFDYYTYGGSGADGLSFFLYDATVSSFTIGGFGGSLGYAQNNSAPGVSKAFLGLGLDEFGNFSNPTAGRQGGPGQRASSVTLRGDGNGSAAVSTNYEYLTGIQTSNAAEMSSANAGTAFQITGGVDGRSAGGLDLFTVGYRRARIDLIPNGMGTGYKLNVWITEGKPEGAIVHHVIKDYSYIPTDSIPASLSYGFSAGTGAMNNYHEVRNLEIKLPEDITVPAPVLADISKSGTENQILTFTGTDFISKFSSPAGNPLAKIKILSLPAHGELKLNSSNITVNQEIVAADLGNIMFVPVSGFSGSASFQWNGSDGAQYAVSGANVTITLVSAPASVFPYSESFKNATASGMLFGGAPGAVLTAGGIDPHGSGYLRLTSNTNTQSGFARNTTAFPSAEGLSINFEYYTYGGSGADGIVFFLYDASVSSFQIGAFGGSLGYAQNAALPGISKGYMGFGFDEFGNFSNPTAGRQGGPGQRASSVTLRGDGNGTGSGNPSGSNYEHLISIQTTDAMAMSAAGAGNAFQVAGDVDGRTAGSTGLTPSMAGYRQARIELKPNGSGTGFKVNVWIREGNPSGGVEHHVVRDYMYVSTDPVPANLSYGFSAGTGAMNNYHEIRNLEIKLPEEPGMQLFTVANRTILKEASLVTEGKVVPAATNVLTPNGDGINDVWFIRNLDKYPLNMVRIYDIKGREVYNKKNYNNDWDGTLRGSLLSQGTYYYIVDFGKETAQLKGFISIIR